jgi:hypothetical protein
VAFPFLQHKSPKFQVQPTTMILGLYVSTMPRCSLSSTLCILLAAAAMSPTSPVPYAKCTGPGSLQGLSCSVLNEEMNQF